CGKIAARSVTVILDAFIVSVLFFSFETFLLSG
ncbi:MAG: hypothetical protein ACI8RD_010980, partial [Bacillariaceae sp.]